MRRRSQVVEAYAECYDCGWVADRSNAGGIAAQHARRTGHAVTATVTMSTHWRSPDASDLASDETARVAAALIAGDDPEAAA